MFYSATMNPKRYHRKRKMNADVWFAFAYRGIVTVFKRKFPTMKELLRNPKRYHRKRKIDYDRMGLIIMHQLKYFFECHEFKND